MKFKQISLTIGTVLFTILAGCSLPDNNFLPAITATSEPTATTIPETLSPHIATSTQIPQPTLAPTLTSEEAIQTFTNFVEMDGDCNLPCWLGVIPGQTDFDEATSNLSKYSGFAYSEFTSQRAFILMYFPNFENAIHDSGTGVTSGDNGKVSQILVYAVVKPDISGNVNYAHPEFQKMWRRFFIPEIFTRYGAPEKIFLDTTLIAADPATSFPFVLWVVYPQEGFLIRYQGLNAKNGDNIRICPIQSRIEIKIWDAEKSNYEEFIDGDRALGLSTSLGTQPIETVTNFDIKSFYQMFKGGQLDTCFETPASLWPPN